MVDMRDPLTMIPVSVPTRFAMCEHVRCFDLITFLENGKWMCPVCGLKGLFNELRVDTKLSTFMKDNKEAEKCLLNLGGGATLPKIKSFFLILGGLHPP